MQKYEHFVEYLKRGRKQIFAGRPVMNNTRVYYEHAATPEHPQPPIHVRFHNTEVLSYYPNGEIHVFLGGFETRTTFERINELSPFYISTWRPFPRRPPTLLVLSLTGSPYWVTPPPGKKRLRVYVIEDSHRCIRVSPDARCSPRALPVFADDREDILRTPEAVLRELNAEKHKQREAKKRWHKRLAKYRNWLRCIENARGDRDYNGHELIRQLLPSLDSMEHNLLQQEQKVQLQKSRLENLRQRTAALITRMEQDREQWACEKAAYEKALLYQQPVKRERSIILETP